MRHVFKPGDAIRGGCESCRKLVSATYDYGTIKLDDGTLVENVMLAKCDVCGEVVAIAHQSASAIKTARGRRDHREKQRTTVRLSRPLADFAASQLLDRGASPERLDLMLKTFISMILDAPDRRMALVDALRSVSDPVLDLRPEVTLHLDVSKPLWEALKELQIQSGLRSLSDFIRRMLVVMDQDVGTEDYMRRVVLYGA